MAKDRAGTGDGKTVQMFEQKYKACQLVWFVSHSTDSQISEKVK
jgi:hypothetical protein